MRHLRNQKGMALLLAVFTVVLITYLANEVSYETNVEYAVNANAVNKLKAYYAAESGLKLSLLRIKLYTSVMKQFGSSIPKDKVQLLDMIWNFPFVWPPILPDEATEVDKDNIKASIKESKMDANYRADIFDEGSKIDINDLASPSKGLREITRKLIEGIFENRSKNDEAWGKNNQDTDFTKIINNLTDWIDDDQQSLNGGNESQFYQSPSYEIPDNLSYPPNRSFRSVDELRLVAGMTEEVFQMLKERVTVYGTKAINPNYVKSEVLQAIDFSITPEVAAKVIARRNNPQEGGPFIDEADFWNYVNRAGARVDASVQQSVPLTFDAVFNFRIRSTGEFSNSTREITAIVYDVASSASAVAKNVMREAVNSGAASTTSTQAGRPGAGTNTNDPLHKGPPRLVYFSER